MNLGPPKYEGALTTQNPQMHINKRESAFNSMLAM